MNARNCLDLPDVTLSLPGPFSIPPVTAGIPIGGGTIGGYCCTFTIPAATPSITIPLPAVAVGAALIAWVASLNAITTALNNFYIPSCPLDD